MCLIYSWSPNCLKPLSKTVSTSLLSFARAATTARRIAMPSPTPAPEDDVNQVTKWPLRDSSFAKTDVIKPAAAETLSASDCHQRKLSSEVTTEDR